MVKTKTLNFVFLMFRSASHVDFIEQMKKNPGHIHFTWNYLPLVVLLKASLLFYFHMLSASMKTVGGEWRTNPKSTCMYQLLGDDKIPATELMLPFVPYSCLP